MAIVTGGDSGIGRAVALAFAREGAHVARGPTRAPIYVFLASDESAT